MSTNPVPSATERRKKAFDLLMLAETKGCLVVEIAEYIFELEDENAKLREELQEFQRTYCRHQCECQLEQPIHRHYPACQKMQKVLSSLC